MTERRGRKRGPGVTLIHVSAGQIIYHLLQTNAVLDSLSGGRGRRVVCEVHEGCQRRCSLTSITLPLISPPRPSPHYSSDTGNRPLVTIQRAVHRARGIRELLKRSHVFISESCYNFSFPFPFHFKTPPSALNRSSPVQITISVESANLCTRGRLFLCVSMLCVCEFMCSMWREEGGGGPGLHLDSGKQADQPLSPTA